MTELKKPFPFPYENRGNRESWGHQKPNTEIMNTAPAITAVLGVKTKVEAYVANRAAAESALASQLENVDIAMPDATRAGYAAAASAVELAHRIEPIVRKQAFAALEAAHAEKLACAEILKRRVRDYYQPNWGKPGVAVHAGDDFAVLILNLGRAATDLEKLQAEFSAS